jgi:phosphoserine phosphatase
MKLAVLDLDNVIFKINDFWSDLMKVFNVEAEAADLREKYFYMDYEYFIKEIFTKLLKGKQATSYKKLINDYEYYPGVKELFQALRKKNMKICLITKCTKELAERVKKDFEVDFILANSFEIQNNILTGSYEWSISLGGDKKAIAVYELTEKEKIKTSDLFIVGDEEDDLEMLQIASVSIGFNAIQNIKDIVSHHADSDLKNIIPFIP